MSQSTNVIEIPFSMAVEYVKKVKAFFEGETFTGVYGLPRGGCTLAVMVSHAMGIPYLPYPKHGCLVVDDISDTGETLSFYKIQGYKTTTMFYHKDTRAMPDFALYEKTDGWIRFPWEVEE